MEGLCLKDGAARSIGVESPLAANWVAVPSGQGCVSRACFCLQPGRQQTLHLTSKGASKFSHRACSSRNPIVYNSATRADMLFILSSVLFDAASGPKRRQAYVQGLLRGEEEESRLHPLVGVPALP